MGNRHATAAVLCAGLALIAVGSLLFPKTINIASSRPIHLAHLAEHISAGGGNATVSLSGPWDTFDEDLQVLQQLRGLEGIVFDVMCAPGGESNVSEVQLQQLQRAFPKCGITFWTGEF